MAAYPSLPQGSAGEEFADDLRADRSVAGGVKVRAFYTGTKRIFYVKHPNLTAAQRTTLTNFYNANRLLTFTFTWGGDGVTYTCVFGSGPRYDYTKGPLANASLTILER